MKQILPIFMFIVARAMAIRRWIESVSADSVRFSEVIDASNLSAGKVWIAGLLSDLGMKLLRFQIFFDCRSSAYNCPDPHAEVKRYTENRKNDCQVQ
jgi:O-phosphoseryl-tRNA(Cys) synthetase